MKNNFTESFLEGLEAANQVTSNKDRVNIILKDLADQISTEKKELRCIFDPNNKGEISFFVQYITNLELKNQVTLFRIQFPQGEFCRIHCLYLHTQNICSTEESFIQAIEDCLKHVKTGLLIKELINE